MSIQGWMAHDTRILCPCKKWTNHKRYEKDRNKSLVPAYPYRKARDGGYDLCSGISVETFKRHPDKYFMF